MPHADQQAERQNGQQGGIPQKAGPAGIDERIILCVWKQLALPNCGKAIENALPS
jgi:hypothetical protein